jgi:hypothetical protein
MAYREPGVKVTQEFANALPALAVFALPNVVVGPVFTVFAQASAGAATYTAGSATIPYPGLPAGSFVDTRAADATDLISYPVAIDFKNTIVRVANTATTGAISGGNLNRFTDATSSVFANIVAGDVIVITGSGAGNNGSFTVRSKVDNNTLQINETFTGAEATISYTIRRNIGALNIPTSTSGVVIGATTVTIPAALTTTVTPIGSCPILSAEVLITYRTLREEASADVVEYGTLAELQADFGTTQILPESPAVFAANLALQNSTTKTNLLALKRDYLTDEGIAYGLAFDILALTDMYAISVMTQNTAIHTALKAHVEGLSDPDKKLERVGIINRQLITTSTVVASKTDGVTSSDGLTFSSVSSHFITDGAVVGQFIKITAPTGNVGRYKISAVVSQTVVTLATAVAGTNPATGVTFTVDKDLTKSDQATVLAAYASSLGSRRMVLTWPDIVKIPVGNAIRQLPGYFLNASVGALTTGLPTQQGLTNLSVATYTGVVHSTKYFDNDQLNTIADGGVMIFVQEVLDETALFIRHQLTTDRSAIKFQEYSVTKNVDFIAKFIRTQHKPFIGQYNIVEGTFDDLKTSSKGLINFLAESTKRPKIGGVIKGGKLQKVLQDPSNIDTITEQYSFDIPIPLNNLDITIVV